MPAEEPKRGKTGCNRPFCSQGQRRRAAPSAPKKAHFLRLTGTRGTPLHHGGGGKKKKKKRKGKTLKTNAPISTCAGKAKLSSSRGAGARKLSGPTFLRKHAINCKVRSHVPAVGAARTGLVERSCEEGRIPERVGVRLLFHR